MKESLQEFFNRGGSVQNVHYKTFEQTAPVPLPGGLRAVINNQRLLSYQGKMAGIASGKARREKALKKRNSNG